MNQVPHIYGTIAQSLGCVWLFATPWTAAHQAPLSFTISWGLLKLMSIEPVMLLAISCSAALFSSHLQSSPASGSFPMSWLFASGGQRIGASASALPMNIQGWFPLRLTSLISLLSQESSHHSSKAPILWHSTFFIIHLSHPYMSTGKTIALIRQTFVGKGMSLLFNMLSRLVISFLARISVF